MRLGGDAAVRSEPWRTWHLRYLLKNTFYCCFVAGTTSLILTLNLDLCCLEPVRPIDPLFPAILRNYHAISNLPNDDTSYPGHDNLYQGPSDRSSSFDPVYHSIVQQAHHELVDLQYPAPAPLRRRKYLYPETKGKPKTWRYVKHRRTINSPGARKLLASLMMTNIVFPWVIRPWPTITRQLSLQT